MRTTCLLNGTFYIVKMASLYWKCGQYLWGCIIWHSWFCVRIPVGGQVIRWDAWKGLGVWRQEKRHNLYNISHEICMWISVVQHYSQISPNPHNRHSISCPLGWDMGCVLWVQTLIYILPLLLYLCLQYHAILVFIIMPHNCILFSWL